VFVQRTLAGDFRGGLSALWDRDILVFFLIGVMLFGVGLVGEYVGRIYQQVRDRPRFTIRAVLERPADEGGDQVPNVLSQTPHEGHEELRSVR
jgi:undecaprenyl-phosphate 4-deoxy-4-formamido-L-arabinose transferase